MGKLTYLGDVYSNSSTVIYLISSIVMNGQHGHTFIQRRRRQSVTYSKFTSPPFANLPIANVLYLHCPIF